MIQIVRLKIDSLREYEKNAKIHTAKQIDQIAQSIRQFGNCDPIAIWGEKNIIVEGHGRLKALQKLGFDEVDCIRLDHLTDTQRRAYMLAHNQLTLNTGFDLDILAEELSALEEVNFDYRLIGLEMPKLDSLSFDDIIVSANSSAKKETENKEIICPKCGCRI